ncbi:MAG: M16 family metallopeptidase [Kiloniellales bacterium]
MARERRSGLRPGGPQRSEPERSGPRLWRPLAHLTALLGLLLAPGLLPEPANARVFDPTSFTLDNGLQVVVVTNHRAPIVTHMIWYKVGAADEEQGESGLAHFLEHLMFKGTDTLAPGEFSKIISFNGGTENAFTSSDYTAYFQTIASDRLEIVMTHEADRMANLRLTDEVVLPERDVVLEERRSRVANEPGSRLAELAQAVLFLNHPYRRPVIGWEHEIRALDTESALAFYEKWYAPNNAVLIVAGDVEPSAVRALAEKTYGKIASKTVPARHRALEPEQAAPRRVTLKDARVRQPAVSIRYLAPSHNTAAGSESYALSVLEEIMGGGATSRLYRDLVVEQGVASSAGAGYNGGALDLGSFVFYASPRPGGEIDEVEVQLRAEIARLLKDGVTAEEVEAAKKRLIAGAIYARDNLSTAPRVIGAALTTGRTIEEVEAWPELIEKVTAEEIDDAARAALRAERSVTSLLLPEPTT